MGEKEVTELAEELNIQCNYGNHSAVEGILDKYKVSGDNKQAVAISCRGLFGYSPLHAASSNGHPEVLKLLLKYKEDLDVNSKTIDGGYTPLHLAASSGHISCVEVLLEHKEIDTNVIDAFGRTPLETAEQNFKNDVAKLLRSHGKKSKTILLCINTAYTKSKVVT